MIPFVAIGLGALLLKHKMDVDAEHARQARIREEARAAREALIDEGRRQVRRDRVTKLHAVSVLMQQPGISEAERSELQTVLLQCVVELNRAS